MRRIVVLAVSAALVFSFAGAVYADGPLKKLGRGIANLVTCPLELPTGIGRAATEDGAIAAFTWGILKGTFNIVKRAGVGAYEIITFPVPFPADYKPILDDPEFFFGKEMGVFRK